MSAYNPKSRDTHVDHFAVRSFEIAQLMTELFNFLCGKNTF